MKKITIEWDECGDAQVGTGNSRPSSGTELQGFDEDDGSETDGGGFEGGTGEGSGTGEVSGDDEDAGPPPAALIRAVEGGGSSSDADFDGAGFNADDFDEADPITDTSGNGESEDAGSGPSGPDTTENEDEGDD